MLFSTLSHVNYRSALKDRFHFAALIAALDFFSDRFRLEFLPLHIRTVVILQTVGMERKKKNSFFTVFKDLVFLRT